MEISLPISFKIKPPINGFYTKEKYQLGYLLVNILNLKPMFFEGLQMKWKGAYKPIVMASI